MTALVIILIGLSKGGLGGALAGLATPLLAIVLPVDKVIGLLLPILMIADLFALAVHWNRWDTKQVLLLVPGALVGVAIGTFFLASISAETLRRLIGFIILIFVTYKIAEPRLQRSIEYRARPWHGVVAGGAAAVASTLAHTGPPPVAIYLLMQKLAPQTFVATMVLFFALLNWFKVPSYFFAGLFDLELLGQVLWLLPLLPLSVWFGKVFVVRLNKEIFDRVIIGLLAISAVFLLVG
jgi:uncharacterized membrane protein YfcA